MIFLHPAFLWGLVAVLIPVAVHLFNFRRYRKEYFSNVERLAALHTESRRQNTLRQWLVLAARVLAVVGLVLAFAHPVLPTTDDNRVSMGDAVVSIYIDNSFSMESADHDGSRLETARQKAREIADAYSPGTRFQLLTNSMEGEEMRWLNRDELAEALDEVAVTPGSRMMSEVAARQSDFMRNNAPGGNGSRHAYLISDFQHTATDLEAMPTDSTVLYTLVPLAGVEADNLYIDTVLLNAPAYFTGGSVSVAVTLRNSSGRAVEKVPVKLYIDNKERALTTLDLEAEASGNATLRFSIDHAGWVDGRVEIEDYPVTFDDSYHFTLLAGEPVGIGEIDEHGSNAHLQKLFEADESVEFHSMRHIPPTMEDYSFFILNEVSHLSSGEVQQLTEWVGEGGSLLVVPSVDDAEGLNILLATLQAPQLDHWVKRTVRASQIDYAGSLYRMSMSGMLMKSFGGRTTSRMLISRREKSVKLYCCFTTYSHSPRVKLRLNLLTRSAWNLRKEHGAHDVPCSSVLMKIKSILTIILQYRFLTIKVSAGMETRLPQESSEKHLTNWQNNTASRSLSREKRNETTIMRSGSQRNRVPHGRKRSRMSWTVLYVMRTYMISKI